MFSPGWVGGRLHRRFTLGTAAGLLISSLVFLILYVGLYRQELASERAEASLQVNALLQTALENAMLKRDLDGLRTIVQRLGEQPSIHAVHITNPTGEIRFSSDGQSLGQRLPLTPEQLADTQPITRMLTINRHQEVLRSINPVANKQPCSVCHGPVAEQPINGVLFVDYDAAPLRDKARNTTLVLMGSGALIVLINIIGGWWFLHRHVLQPIASLSGASRALTRGDLSTRTRMRGQDELSELGATFDRMADRLSDKIEQLERQETFLQNLVDAIPDGVRIIGPDFRIRLTNQAYRDQMGTPSENVVGGSCHAASHGRTGPCPPTLITCPVHEVVTNSQPIKALHRHRRADGSEFDVEIFAAPMPAIIDGQEQILTVESIRDLSKQVEYSQEQKLFELGRLAAGVAHEIHNPLSSIRLALHASLDNLSKRTDDATEVGEYLRLVDREIDQCIEVTERLLKLSAPPPSQLELVGVEAAILETLSLLKWEAEQSHISVVQTHEPGLRILASDSELRMIVLNLVQNSFHAMPQGGDLRIDSYREDDQVCIRVTDSGIGIRAQDMQHIFDPFFSRRADKEPGTGLGLSIVHALVERFGGKISVESSQGEGCRFLIEFPDLKQ